MNFSEALAFCMYHGARITRRDWNGKNMYVYYTPGRKIPVKEWDDRGNIEPTDSERSRGYIIIKGHFDMYNAQGERIIGWLASQTDMASDKWEVVE